MKKCLRLGIPFGAQGSLIAFSCVALQSIINRFGSDVIAVPFRFSASAPALFAPSATSFAIASVLPVPLQYTTAILLIIPTSFL